MNSIVSREALRFLVAGAANTAITYALYLALLPVLNYALAYSIAYVIGIGLAYLLNTRFVFRVPQNLRSLMLFPLVYAAQYVVGVIALHVAVQYLGVPQKFALLASIAVTIPVTYLLSRFVLKPRDAAVPTSIKESSTP